MGRISKFIYTLIEIIVGLCFMIIAGYIVLGTLTIVVTAWLYIANFIGTTGYSSYSGCDDTVHGVICEDP